ncbi:MAG: hypothetical protein WB392_06915 [Methanotrichaceae archaeon]
MSQNADDRIATFPATVAAVIDMYKVVINRGSEHGVKVGDRFLIYRSTNEIIDPETKKSLGRLELSKGKGSVIFTDPKMALVESDEFENPFAVPTVFSAPSPKKPFDKPEIGDKAKPI